MVTTVILVCVPKTYSPNGPVRLAGEAMALWIDMRMRQWHDPLRGRTAS